MWEVEFTDQFGEWWNTLDEHLQERIADAIDELSEQGPALSRPRADTLEGARHPNMKELRIGGTIRILFAFDPRRVAILLLGGDKRGRRDWYDSNLPIADRLYDDHLDEITKEGTDDG